MEGRAALVLIILVGVGVENVESKEDTNCERIKCESQHYQYAECSVRPARTIISVTVDDKVSRSACLFHDGKPPAADDREGDGLYGYSDSSMWVHRGCRAWFEVCYAVPIKQSICERMKCESWDFEFKECSVETAEAIINVTVYNKVSRSACDFHNTKPSAETDTGGGKYGYYGNSFWVHRGCRAWFDVCYLEKQNTVPEKQNSCQRVKCESKGYKYAECPVQTANTITSVTVHDKVSRSACLFRDGKPADDDTDGGGLYGFHGNTLWVHKGCRAWFDVCFSGQSGTCRRVKCESWEFKYAECHVEKDLEIHQVNIYDKVSVSNCTYHEGAAPDGYTNGQGGLYGYTGTKLWVHRGCRAWFEVCLSDTSEKGLPEPLWKRACYNARVMMIIVAPVLGVILAAVALVILLHFRRRQHSDSTGRRQPGQGYQYFNNTYATLGPLTSIKSSKNTGVPEIVFPSQPPAYTLDSKEEKNAFNAPPEYQEKPTVR